MANKQTQWQKISEELNTADSFGLIHLNDEELIKLEIRLDHWKKMVQGMINVRLEKKAA